VVVAMWGESGCSGCHGDNLATFYINFSISISKFFLQKIARRARPRGDHVIIFIITPVTSHLRGDPWNNLCNAGGICGGANFCLV